MKGRAKAVHPSPGRLYFSRVCPPWAGHRRGACQIANRLFHGVSLHSCTERKKVCLSFYRRDMSDRIKHIRMWLNWRTHRRVPSSTFPQAQRCDRKLARASAEKACNCSQMRSPGSSSHRISRCRGVHRQMARHRLPCGLLGIPFLAGMQRGGLHQFTPIEANQGRIDHVSGPHEDLLGQVFERKTADLREIGGCGEGLSLSPGSLCMP